MLLHALMPRKQHSSPLRIGLNVTPHLISSIQPTSHQTGRSVCQLHIYRPTRPTGNQIRQTNALKANVIANAQVISWNSPWGWTWKTWIPGTIGEANICVYIYKHTFFKMEIFSRSCTCTFLWHNRCAFLGKLTRLKQIDFGSTGES